LQGMHCFDPTSTSAGYRTAAGGTAGPFEVEETFRPAMASSEATAVDAIMAHDSMVKMIMQSIMDLFFILNSLPFIRRRYAAFAARGTGIQGHPGKHNNGNYKKHFHSQASFCSGLEPAASLAAMDTKAGPCTCLPTYADSINGPRNSLSILAGHITNTRGRFHRVGEVSLLDP